MTTRERKKRIESPSGLTELSSRMDTLETNTQKLAEITSKLADSLDSINGKLTNQGKLPIAVKPDDRIAAMKEAKLGGEAVSRHKSVDLRHPEERGGFKEDDVVRLVENSPKYAAYQMDENGEPVKQIFTYQCQACANQEPCSSHAAKKVCAKCGNTMLRMATGSYEPGTPAYGVVLNAMYKSRRGGWKYKVQFEKFGKEGLSEAEMVLCQ